MATVLEPLALPSGEEPGSRSIGEEPGLLRRPSAAEGVWSWITTVDHKRIGVLYGATAFFFFLVGGIEALLIRLQLARPNGTILSAEKYNQVFTMHGTTMVFLVIMPMAVAFFNYFIPIMLGARDVAFPRLNAFSYWTFLLGGLFLFSSFLFGGAPNGGWFGYTPLTSQTYALGRNIDFWVFGLMILGIASTVGAANFIVTILNMRAPGMTLMRMPIFMWSALITNFLLLFALPIITVALVLLTFDRQFGANFFNPAAGGDPVLWQHLFWLFGHPEVYILILPAFGMVSEILPVFSRKPLFGYPVMAFSIVAIAFLGFGVWAHHMFAVGLGPVAVSAFSIATMFIAVPTGVKIFNWIATMWGGSLRFTTPMLFAVGLVAMFTIGGLSGVTHAVSPHDRQQTDTYYIVAHFHYVIFGGSLFGFMAGIYYWYPKVFGHMLNEKIGKWHFWTWIVGLNLTFGPQHFLGLQGMPRRIYTYPEGMGWDFWNLVSSIGAFTIALSTLIFLHNVRHSYKHRTPAPPDPWDGRTLEWAIPSPTPVYNFARTPAVHGLDEFWHRKYGEDANGRLVRIAPTADALEPGLRPGQHIHLPSPSYYPLVASVGLPIMGYSLVFDNYVVAVLGAVVMVAGFYAWALEPSAEPEVEDEETAAEHGPGDPALVAVADGAAAGDGQGNGHGAAPSGAGGAVGEGPTTAATTTEEGGS